MGRLAFVSARSAAGTAMFAALSVAEVAHGKIGCVARSRSLAALAPFSDIDAAVDSLLVATGAAEATGLEF